MNTILISCTRRQEVARQVQQEWLAAQRTGLATRDFTHRPGLKTFDFLLVHGGGLPFGFSKGVRLYSRDF